MIEVCKQMISRIEEEITSLERDCSKLDEVKKMADQRDKLYETGDVMLRCVTKAYEQSSGLHCMEQFQDEMRQTIKGPGLTNAMDGMEELLHDIEQERSKRGERLKELMEELHQLTQDLGKMLTGDGENG